MSNLLVDVLLGAGRHTPDKVAIWSSTSSMTYRELDELSARMAHALRARGVSAGDRVVVQTPKAPPVVALNIACARLGALYVPLNSDYTEREVSSLLDDAEPSLVVRDRDLDGAWPRVSLAELVRSSKDGASHFVDVDTDEATPAAIVFTSGTTGRPKGAVLTQGNLVFGGVTLSELWAITSEDVLVHVLPLYHIHGLFVATYCALASGASIRLLARFDVSDVLDVLPDSTLMMGVPTHYTRLLADPRFTAEVAAPIRVFISGSAPMLTSTHDEFLARTGQRILERYGMTETGIITSNPLGGERRPGTVGLAVPGVDVRAGDTPSIVQVRGPNVFAGYWRRPELRESEFTPEGFFLTGDLGVLDADGYLEIVGRSKDVIITGGLNVYPREVELIIDEFPGVIESAVVGVPDADFGETVVAVIASPPHAVDLDDLRGSLRAALAPFKVPRRFLLVEELPRNTMGKVQKARLRAELAEGRDS